MQRDNPITANDISEVYRRMSRLFGYKFVSNYGTSDDGTWLMALTGLYQSDLTRGMSALMNIPNAWPPSVPEFKQLCLGISVDAIQKKAKLLAIEEAGGSFNFKHLTVAQCRARINEMLNRATLNLMEDHLELTAKGELNNHLTMQRQELTLLEKRA